MENEMYKLAMSYLARGWSVLPCGKNKIPLIPWKCFTERFPTESEIKSWFEKYPEAQVGIITGKLSNLTVIDFEKGADPSIVPQNTMIVSTGGGGYHYYYFYEEGVTNKARILPLVDYRSEGGFVVAGGSVSEKGSYTILQDVPLLPFPKEVLPKTKVDIFQYPETNNSQSFQKRELKSYPGYGEGQRNQGMASYIGHVLTQIHPADWDSKGWAIIEKANQSNMPPLTRSELLATFSSIKRTERQNNPFGHAKSVVMRSSPLSDYEKQLIAESSKGPIILDDKEDEIKHIADVADAQKINTSEVFPLEMPCFDKVINGGVNLGDMIVIAGPTGQGKTTLCQDWTMSLIRSDKKLKALWFSYEVLPVHLWNKFQEMGMTREDCVFVPAKHSTGNVAWVEKKIQEGKEKFGIKAVFIDHLGFLLPKTEGVLGKNFSSNYASFLTQVMRDLKTIAIQEEVIIFLPVHMRKKDSNNKRSDVDDIRDSGGIAQESDLVFLIERERDKDKDAKSYFTDNTKITLAKNRKTGTTVIGNFSMINGRFAYDDSKEKAEMDFKDYGEVKKVEEEVVEKVETVQSLPYYNQESGDDEEYQPADPATF